MAKIFRGNGLIITDEAQSEARDFAINYWGSLGSERIFPIAFWKIRQMLSASNSKQIALKITGTDNPNDVDGTWMVFEESLADSLADPVEENSYYFVLDDTLFLGPIITSEGKMDGLWKINNTPANNIIRGRIGKNPITNQIYAFFQAAECKIIGIGGSGQGASTGYKIPSP